MKTMKTLLSLGLLVAGAGIGRAQQARPLPDHFGDGSDGDLVVSTTIDVNVDRSVLSASFGPGPATIQLASPAFAVGDEVLVHQTQCSIASRAGQYDLAMVQAVAGDMVTLSGLRHAYLSGSSEQPAPNANVAQVVRIPHYRNVHILPQGRIRPGTWAGEEGGIVAMRVRGLLQVEGLITTDALGFFGGAGDNAGTDEQANQGESYRGLGSESVLANDGGGGGGRTQISPADDGAGGGGAGHELPGEDGVPHNSSGIGGEGGDAYPVSTLARGPLLFGSGGGGGSIDLESDGLGNGHSGNGGRGGGIVLILARFVDISGAIRARGENGANAANSRAEHGGGGGGSGGTILLIYDQGSIAPGALLVDGGVGGLASGDVMSQARGGVGSAGHALAIEL
jgi:hypothetical protein